MKVRTASVVLLSALGILAITGFSDQAEGQKRPARTAPRAAPRAAPRVATAVVTRAVTPPAALRAKLGQKRHFDQKSLESVLTYSARNIPRLKLKGGKQVFLEQAVAEPTVTASALKTSPILATQLRKYQSYSATVHYGAAVLAASAVANGVDHRNTQTPVRDQADRGTCVAHAAVAAIEAIYKKRDGVTKDLSENHAYNVFMQKESSTCMADPGIQTWKAAGYLTTDRICEESQSPYVTTTAAACATVQPACQSDRSHGYLATSTSTFFAPAFGGTGTNIATNTNYLETLLDAGNDVVMGVYVAGNDWHNGTAETGVVDVQLLSNGNPSSAYGGHAMLMVGYYKPGNYFIFKNSWGPTLGHNGYFYLSYEYLQTYAKYGYVVSSATPS